MIHAKSTTTNFLTEYTDGIHAGISDAPAAKGGADGGFSPFALLEASLATCMNITLRMYAQTHNIPLTDVDITVSIIPGKDGATFEYGATLPDTLSADQKKRLHAALRGCPIHQLLSKPATFTMKAE